jgi:hypothetical protein
MGGDEYPSFGGWLKGTFFTNAKIAGEDILAVDIVAVRLMGFEPIHIPHLKSFLKNTSNLDDIMVINEAKTENGFFYHIINILILYHPHIGEDYQYKLIAGPVLLKSK